MKTFTKINDTTFEEKIAQPDFKRKLTLDDKIKELNGYQKHVDRLKVEIQQLRDLGLKTSAEAAVIDPI